MPKITVVCGWCGKKLAKKDGQGVEGESHKVSKRKVRIVPATKINRR